MFKPYYLIFLCFSLTGLYAQKQYDYTLAPKESTSNNYFNTKVYDPYQWMENPEDTRLYEWIESQNKFAKKIKRSDLKMTSLRGQIATMYWGIRRRSIEGNIEKDTSKKSKYQFKYKTQNRGRFPNLLYRLRDSGNYQVLVDIKKYMNDRDDHVAIYRYTVNEEYDLAAVKLSRKGSDWQEIVFFNLKNGQQLYNTLKYVRTGSTIIWDKMNVYYDRYEKPEAGRELLDKAVGQKLYYHKFGSPQEEDVLLFEDSSGIDIGFDLDEFDENLFFYHTFNHKGSLYKSLSVTAKDSTFLNLKKFFVYPNDNNIRVSIEEVFGNKVLLKTNWNASNGRVLLADTNNPNRPIEIVPEYDVVLKEVNRLGKDKFVCIYKNGNRDLALFFDLNGKLIKKIDFPEGKKVNGLYEKNDDVTYTQFSVSSFYHPDLWYQLSLDDLTFKPITSVSVPYDPESLETRYVKYTSKDGTEIPMYITCLKSTKLNGKNPTLLYGYGGYGRIIEPNFDESKGLWLLHGGILAIPNVRGGGAEGSEWGQAGRRLKKQNAIDDFIAAAEFLVQEGYTSSPHLGSNGGSHGGLLVSSAAIQRPDLFKAVVAEAGPYDMLRFEKFTVGAAQNNKQEFGNTSNYEEFQNLMSYSPMQNIKSGIKYPNILLMTGENDDRVPPLHSYKFLATLQEKASPESLYLMYLVPGSGHGGPLSSDDFVDKILYKYAFLYDQLF